MDAVKAGKIDPRFVAHIADSVGLNQAETDRRIQNDYHAQLAAEAMGGVEEISEAARGMLPHPETARQRQHPLAGELQRLYDSLKTPTRRRRKDGSTIDSTQRANAFFLPIGEWESPDDVRQSLNEKGFAFDTPAALLSALDDSLNYNLKSYATQGGMLDQSFSIGFDNITQSTRDFSYETEANPSQRIREVAARHGITIVKPAADSSGWIADFERTSGIQALLKFNSLATAEARILAARQEAGASGIQGNAEESSQLDQSFSVGGMKAAKWADYQSQGRAFTGADGKPRFEMDASQALFNAQAIQDPAHRNGYKRLGDDSPLRWILPPDMDTPLGNILAFNELFENYPQLAGLMVRLKTDNSSGRGAFTLVEINGKPAMEFSTISLSDRLNAGIALNVLLHEVQHAIQRIEGFPPGSSPERMQRQYDSLVAKYADISSSKEMIEAKTLHFEAKHRAGRG